MHRGVGVFKTWAILTAWPCFKCLQFLTPKGCILMVERCHRLLKIAIDKLKLLFLGFLSVSMGHFLIFLAV